MTDCPNAEMRDRLPDLLHEQLDESARAAVVMHVEGCSDCRMELALLQEAHVALVAGIRSIDVTMITRIVVERFKASATVAPRRPRWLDWRIAASLAVIATGAASFAAVRGARHGRVESRVLAVAPASPAGILVGASTQAIPTHVLDRGVTVVSARNAELSAAGGVSDLDETELRALLRELNQIDAIPATEPEPVTVRVALPGVGSSE